jgi:hypothetical protein
MSSTVNCKLDISRLNKMFNVKKLQFILDLRGVELRLFTDIIHGWAGPNTLMTGLGRNIKFGLLQTSLSVCTVHWWTISAFKRLAFVSYSWHCLMIRGSWWDVVFVNVRAESDIFGVTYSFVIKWRVHLISPQKFYSNLLKPNGRYMYQPL